jgi:hypothetical protein
LLLTSLAGSYLNIPVAQLSEQQIMSGQEVPFFGMHYVIPVVIEWPSTVVAVNVGSAVIPGFLSFYLLVKNRLWARGILATAGVAAVCHLLARPIPWPWNRTSRVRAAYIGGGRRAAAVAPAGRADRRHQRQSRHADRG